MIDRLEEAEKDAALKEKIIDALGPALNAVAKERDDLFARIKVMEQPVPICRAEDLRNAEILLPALGLMPEDKLYALPGAQDVPKEAIAKILTEVMNVAVANGADSRSMPDEYVEVAAWLCGIPAAAPEARTPALNTHSAGYVVQTVCHEASRAAGWWQDLKTGVNYIEEVRAGTRLGKALVAEKLMLIVSEVSEAMEGHRKGLADDKLPHRPAIEVELADAVIRIGDLAGALGLDLGAAITEKLAYNAQRADHKPENRAQPGGKEGRFWEAKP